MIQLRALIGVILNHHPLRKITCQKYWYEIRQLWHNIPPPNIHEPPLKKKHQQREGNTLNNMVPCKNSSFDWVIAPNQKTGLSSKVTAAQAVRWQHAAIRSGHGHTINSTLLKPGCRSIPGYEAFYWCYFCPVPPYCKARMRNVRWGRSAKLRPPPSEQTTQKWSITWRPYRPLPRRQQVIFIYFM